MFTNRIIVFKRKKKYWKPISMYIITGNNNFSVDFQIIQKAWDLLGPFVQRSMIDYGTPFSMGVPMKIHQTIGEQ